MASRTPPSKSGRASTPRKTAVSKAGAAERTAKRQRSIQKTANAANATSPSKASASKSPVGKTIAKKKIAGKVAKSTAGKSPVQAGTRRQPENPLPRQHQAKPGCESALDPQPRFLAPDYAGSGKLQGKVALITGGDSGIGRAVAVLFAREGADVAIAYLSEDDDAQATKAHVEREGARCVLIAGDVKDAAFCERAVAQTVDALGGLDILVNNAAFQQHSKSLEDMTEAHLQETLQTNIGGYFHMARAALPYLGEGATSAEDFHTGLNFAAVFRVPVVFLCVNNGWAVSTPASAQSASETFAVKALAYGMPGVRVDGGDVLAVYEATREAVERARNGDGPSFIEAVSYRAAPHATADDPRAYIDLDRVEEEKRNECVGRYDAYLRRLGVLDDATAEEIKNEALEAMRQGIAEAEAEPDPDPELVFDNAYVLPPPNLREGWDA